MSSVVYPRRALDPGEIRLIRLLPGRWSDEIRCQLFHEFLRHEPSYQALSYVWGSQNVTRPILLDGEIHTVTFNLESALRRLRQQQKRIVLWVDALCINQADIRERTHQVGFMGEIFGSAANVIVYLGDGIDRYGTRGSEVGSFASITPPTYFFDDDRDLSKLDAFVQECWTPGRTNANQEPKAIHCSAFNVFCLIRMLALNKHLADISFFAEEMAPKKVQNDHRTDLFEALRRLMHPPWTHWWGRIWVVQEVVMPRKVTVVYGMMSAPWAMFAKAAFNYTGHAHSCCSKTIEFLPRDYSKVLADFSQHVRDIEELRAAYLDQRIARRRPQKFKHISIPPEMLCNSVQVGQRSLLSLLRRFRARKATDPRDKVYALLSLVQYGESQSPMVPDYSLSESEVFRQAVLESIYSTGSLSVLTADLSRKFRQDLPTWVPDWDAPGDYSQRAWIDAVELYDASGGERATVEPVTNKILRVEGIHIDRITSLGEVMWADSSKGSRDTLLEWCNTALSFQPSLAVSVHRPPPIRMSWKILCADAIHSSSGTTTLRRFRRTEAEDEIMFLTWALHAERSPFREAKSGHSLKELLSSEGKNWKSLLEFEERVLENDHLAARVLFQTLIPSEVERMELVEDALITEWGVPRGKSVLETAKEWLAERIRQPKKMDKQQLVALAGLPWRKIHDSVKNRLLQQFSNISRLESLSTELQIASIDTSIMSATLNRRLFITRDGHIGLGPASLREEDELYLIKGGRTPFVLRRNREERHFRYQESRLFGLFGVKSFELVGDCYAHGMMDFNNQNIHSHSNMPVQWRKIDLV